MQHHVPKGKALIKIADLAQDLGAEYKDVGKNFKSCGQFQLEAALYQWGDEQQQFCQQAGEHVFPTGGEDIAHCHANDGTLQHKIKPEGLFVLADLIDQRQKEVRLFHFLCFGHFGLLVISAETR